jgi:hypothetical protein
VVKQKLFPFRTASAVAHEIDSPTDWVSRAVRRGIVNPARDSNGRSQFSDDDVATLRRYRARVMRTQGRVLEAERA